MSNIDPSKPTYGKAYTASVRQNFLYAKQEIEELKSSLTSLVGDVSQGMFLPLIGGQLTGSLLLAYDPAAPTEAATKRYVDLLGSNIAANYLPLIGGTISGNLTVVGTTAHNGATTIGTNTAAANFAINGAAGQARNLFFQTAGVNRWGWRADNSAEGGSDAGSDFILAAYPDAGGANKGSLLTFDRLNGAQSFTPYTTVFSGADRGTAGSTMHYNYQGKFSGSTTSPTIGTTFNRWWITQDTITDIAQGVYYHFEADYGPATTGGGRTGMQVILKGAGNMTLIPGGACSYTGFRTSAQSNFDGGGSLTQAGGALQGLDIISYALPGSTNWAANINYQANQYVAAGNNMHQRVAFFGGVQADAGVQAGRVDAYISVGINGVDPYKSNTIVGAGYRSLICIGQGGTSIFPIDGYNGAIVSATPPIAISPGMSRVDPQACFRGIDLSNINMKDGAWWSPGVRIGADGTTRINQLQVSASANGPVIDAPLLVASITSIASSFNNFKLGEQVYDHLGGVAVVDTVNASNNVTAAHYLYPPRLAVGEVRQVASAFIATTANIGDTIIRMRNGSVGPAIGDVVTTAAGIAGISAGTTVVDFTPTSTTNATMTLSSPLTANLAYGTMFLFIQTMPINQVTFRTGSQTSFVANISWTAATTLSLGSSGVATTIVGPATLSNGGTLSGTFAGNPTFTGNLTVNGTSNFGTVTNFGTNTTANPIVQINGATASSRRLTFKTAGLDRWRITGNSNTETGVANAGTNLDFTAMDDLGITGTNALRLLRTDQSAEFFGNVIHDKLTTLKGGLLNLSSFVYSNTQFQPGNYAFNFFNNYSGFSIDQGPFAFNSIQGVDTVVTAWSVTAITQANPGAVTCSFAHGMQTGNIVTFSGVQGMTSLNTGTYTITVLNPTRFTIGIDTTSFPAFIAGGATVTSNNQTSNSRALVMLNYTASIGTSGGLALDIRGGDGATTGKPGYGMIPIRSTNNFRYNQGGTATAPVGAEWCMLLAMGDSNTATGLYRNAGRMLEMDMSISDSSNIALKSFIKLSGDLGDIATGFLDADHYIVFTGNIAGAKWRYGLTVTSYDGFYPFSGKSTLIDGGRPANGYIAANGQPIGWGVDLNALDPQQGSFRSKGFFVDKDGTVQVGAMRVAAGSIDMSGLVATGITYASGGANWLTGDPYFIQDAENNIVGFGLLGTVNVNGVPDALSLTSGTVVRLPVIRSNVSPPTTLTVIPIWGRHYISATSFIVNVTWATTSTISIGSSTVRTMTSSGSGTVAPTTAQLPAGMSSVWKNTTDASVRLYYNDGGTMRSVVMN